MRPICPSDFKHFMSLITEKPIGHQNVKCATLTGKYLKLKRVI